MITFLDFDGVTHGWGNNDLPFNPDCLTALADVLIPCKAEIVIASSWREKYEVYMMKEFLGPLGKLVIGSTPVIDDPFIPNVRYHECSLWLRNNLRGREKWIAIDDEVGNYPIDAPVYFTDTRRGFCESDVDKLDSLIKMCLEGR